VAGAGIAYAQQILLARLLGVSQYGLYTYVWIWAGFLALLAGLGLPAASLRFLAEYRAHGDHAAGHLFVALARRLTYAVAVAVAALAVAVGLALSGLGVLGKPAPLLLGGLLVPALAGSILCTELARASGRVGAAYLPPQVLRPAMIVLAVTLAALLMRVSAAVALAGTVTAAYLVLAAQELLRGRASAAGVARRALAGERRNWLGVGLSLLAVSAFVVVMMQLDVAIVGAVLGTRDAGVYAAASKTATLVSFVIFAVNAIAAPRFASLWAQRRVDELQQLVRELAGMIFWPSLAIASMLALLSAPLLALFGPGFAAGRGALLILLVGQLVNAGAGSVGYLLTLTGHQRDAVRALACSAVVFLALSAAGAATAGMPGAALGAAIGLAMWNLWMCRLVSGRLGIRASIIGARR
jgi:O-antigen/teichoic acid export membrane protein